MAKKALRIKKGDISYKSKHTLINIDAGADRSNTTGR